MRIRNLLVALLALVVVCAAAPAMAKTYKLRVATVVSPVHPWISGMEFMAQELDKRSNGEVKMTISHSSVLGSDQTTIDEMRMGTVDMVVGGVTAVSSFVPEYALLSIPYLFKDYDAFKKATAADSPMVKMYQGLYAEHKLGLKLLGLTGGGLRNVSNNLRPIVTPADMQGMKMRVPSNPLLTKIWGATGAIPSPLPWKEIYSAVQTGVVNCFDSSVSGYYGSRYYEVAPYMSLTGHQFMVSHLSMSEVSWKRLPEKFQKLVAEVAAEACVKITELAEEGDNAKIKTMAEKHGVKVNEVDKESFLKLYRPLQDELASDKPHGKEILDIIRSM
ncbi:TRAP transporter substrate-binding protein [Desulfocurvus sp. DL9XJH121]